MTANEAPVGNLRDTNMDNIHSSQRLIVHRVTDPSSEDLLDALKIYTRRIPEEEQFEPSDIVRWVQESSAGPTRDYFLVAKLEDQVLGFVLFHYSPRARLAFIAYLVAAKHPGRLRYSSDNVSRTLLSEVNRLLKVEDELKQCEGLLLEVDRPSGDVTEQESHERIARIRLFCTLAQAQGFSLRALDMNYYHPPVSLAHPEVAVPMLLMYLNPRPGNPRSYMSRKEVRGVLKFIYTELYPENYSECSDETRTYRKLMSKLYLAQAKSLPDRIALLNSGQLRALLKPSSDGSGAQTHSVCGETSYNYDVFLSYRHAEPDRTFARRLLKDLEAAGLKVSIDERDFDPTARFLEEMESCIKSSRFTLCLLSPRYFDSENTQEEAVICRVLDLSERKRRLLPVIIEKVRVPTWLYDIVGIDFTQGDPLIDPLERLKSRLMRRR